MPIENLDILNSKDWQCFTAFPNTSKFFKNTALCILFSVLFSVFGNVVNTLNMFDIFYCQSWWLENPDGLVVLLPVNSGRMYVYTFICGTGYSGNAPHVWDAKEVCLIECLSCAKVEFFVFQLILMEVHVWNAYQRSLILGILWHHEIHLNIFNNEEL